MKRWRGVVLAVLSSCLLWSCSSSGGNIIDPPPAGGGRVQGTLGQGAGGATVRLDGTDLTTRAAADGSFVLDDVPPGEYTLAVEAAGGQGAAVLCRVQDGRITTIPQLPLTTGGQISGLVLSRTRQDGPLAGAKVTVRRVDYVWDYAGAAKPEIVDELGGTQPGGGGATDDLSYPPRITTTDGDGSYRFTGLPEGPYVVEVTADDHESTESATWVSPGLTSPVDVSLLVIDPDNAELTGRILGRVDGVSVPLAYVTVSLWPQDTAVILRSHEEGGEGESEGGEGESEGGVGDGGEPGDDDINDVNDLFDATGWGQGGPPDDVDPWFLPPWAIGKQTMTDENGEFALRNVPPGDYVLSIWRYGYEQISQDITLGVRDRETFNQTIDSTLVEVSGTVFGRLEGGDVVPLEGAYVHGFANVWGPVAEIGADDSEVGFGDGAAGNLGAPDAMPPDDRGSAVTDANGNYTITVEAGRVALEIWADGYQWSWTEFSVDRTGASGVDVILEPWSDEFGGGGGGEDGQPPRPMPLGAPNG